MKKFLLLFAMFIFLANVAHASEIDGIKYWNGDLNCPIFEELSGGKMICFNINSAHASTKFHMGNDGKLIELTGYAVNDAKIYETHHDYYIWIGNKIVVLYPENKLFGNGKIFYVENPIQAKICDKIFKKVYE